jgi:hypothetical protein
VDGRFIAAASEGAAAAFAGCHPHDTAVALYKHRDAARRLIAGWETVGSE